jgi:hypothetical protein
MNIILKSFDGNPYDKMMLEHALGALEIETCISIANDTELLPDIDCSEHQWIPATPLRAGDYSHIDWSDIPPIDEELIEKMRNTQAVFLTMVQRYALEEDMLYHERKRQYLQHLRYWNHILSEYNINLVLMNHTPHQGYDFILYNLAKHRNIPVIHIERAYLMDMMFMCEDWEKSGEEVQQRFIDLKEQGKQEGTPITLSQNTEAYFKGYTERTPEPYFMKTMTKHTQPKSFLSIWGAKAMSLLVHKPKKLFRSILSFETWKRKINQHKTKRFYFHSSQQCDLTIPYIYVPLHAQPEMSTSPLAGAFEDQELMIQLIAASLPKGVLIYVKEHPLQGESCRSMDFYKDIISIPSVRFVSKSQDTFELIKHAQAVAAGTGTPIFQSIFKGTPALMFGHRFFQFAPGVYSIRNSQDCKNAIDDIFVRNATPLHEDLRIFLRAAEDCSVPYTGPPNSPHEQYSQEEKAVFMGKKITSKIQAVTHS